MKEKIRDLENELNSLKIDVRRTNERMIDLLEVLSDMRSKYATQLGISDNQFIDLERVR
tara:strand:+ start:5067 stop:5243 length:177 start_codon:yes stop_codon:yes gene_type:complete